MVLVILLIAAEQLDKKNFYKTLVIKFTRIFLCIKINCHKNRCVKAANV